MRRYTPLAFIAISLMAIFVAFGTEGAVTTTGAGGSGSGPTPPPAQTYLQWIQSLNPTFVYALDDTSGTTAVDSSTNANNGTYAASGVTLNQPEQGCCGTNTVLFNQTGATTPNGLVNSPIEESNSIFSGSFTVGVEIYIGTAFPGYGTYNLFGTDDAASLGNCSSSAGAGFALQLVSTGYVVSYGQYGTQGCSQLATSQTTPLTGWHLFNLVYNATAQTVSVYIDGSSVYSATYTGGMNGTNAYYLSFGNLTDDANNQACPCYMGYAYLVPVALTSAQISTGYSAWTQAPTPTPSPTPGTLPAFGVYSSCEIDSDLSSCESSDDTMVTESGLSYEINYIGLAANETGANSLTSWLAYDQTIGMHQFLVITDTLLDTTLSGTNLIQNTTSGACGTNSCLAEGCGATTDQQLLQCIDTICQEYTSCAGYYLYDEPGGPNEPSSGAPPAGNFQMLNTVAAYIRSIDTTKVLIGINTGGGNSSESATAPYFSCDNQAPCATPTAPVTPFPWITTSLTPNTGFDWYPLAAPAGEQTTAEATAVPGTLPGGQSIAQSDQTWGYLKTIFQANYPEETASFTAQAFSWYQEGGTGCSVYTNCVYPTQSQEQLERDHALYYASAAGIPLKYFFWYYWPDIDCANTFTGCSASANEAQLLAVDSEAFPATPPP